jgi:outer membrane protein W
MTHTTHPTLPRTKPLCLSLLAAAALIAVPAVASAAATPRCVIGAHAGVSDNDARVATELVCDEVRKAGVPVVDADDDGGDVTGDVYRVQLQLFGRTTIVRLSHERDGQVVRAERMTLAAVDEVQTVAPRLATAVVTGKPLAETAHVDDLSAGETRKYEKKAGELLWGGGIAGFGSLNGGGGFGPGLTLSVMYETPELAAGVSYLYGTNDTGGSDYNSTYEKLSMHSFQVFGRYFLGRGDVAPYFGAGLGYTSLDSSKYANGSSGAYSAYDYKHLEGNGFGGFASVGLEMLRLHKVRMAVEARVDVPFFALSGSTTSGAGYAVDGTYSSGTTSTERRWVMPVSIAASFSF